MNGPIDVGASGAEKNSTQAAASDTAPRQLKEALGLRLWRTHRPWIQELVLVVAMYSLYSVTRSAAPDRVSLAMKHADWIEWAERGLAIDIELDLNKLFLRHLWLADAASLWYQLAHMFVTFGLLIWLFFWRRGSYGVLRSSLALLWLAGLTTYWLFPLAPPRFALAGAVDTMTEYPILFAGKESVTGLANLYAAMPSLHVGWATWVALAWVYTHKGAWRHLAWVYPCIMTFVVVGTANHYVLDAVGGASYAIGCFFIVKAVYARVAKRRASRERLGTPGGTLLEGPIAGS